MNFSVSRLRQNVSVVRTSLWHIPTQICVLRVTHVSYHYWCDISMAWHRSLFHIWHTCPIIDETFHWLSFSLHAMPVTLSRIFKYQSHPLWLGDVHCSPILISTVPYIIPSLYQNKDQSIKWWICQFFPLFRRVIGWSTETTINYLLNKLIQSYPLMKWSIWVEMTSGGTVVILWG